MLTVVGATCSGGLRAQAPSLQHIERRHDQGDRDAAMAALTRLLRARPRDVDAWLLMARLCNRQGDFAAAEQAARRAAELAPGSATASLELGVSLSRRGDEEAAREHLERAVAQSGGEVRLLAGRAAQRAAAGDWDGSVADYDAALRLAPDSPGLQWGRGRALMGLGEFVLAADALDRARERWPPGSTADPASGSAVCCDLALAHFELGAGGRSLDLLQRQLEGDPRDAAARLLRIRLATRLGRLDEAAADCRAGLALAPDAALRAALNESLGVVWLLRGDDAAARHALVDGGDRAALLRWATLFAADPAAAGAALPDDAKVTSVMRPLFAFARDGDVASVEGLAPELRCAVAFVAATRAAAAGHELGAEVEWLRVANGAFESPLVDVARSHLQRRRGGALATDFGCDLAACDGGLRVTAVVRFGPAAEQGLRAGDVLLRVGRFDADLDVWLEQPGHRQPGLETVVVVRRDGAERALRLRSGLQPNAAHRAFVAPPPAARPN